jgi:primary-amine oxidase
MSHPSSYAVDLKFPDNYKKAISRRTHPLYLINDEEIAQACALVKHHAQETKVEGSIRFKNISLHEPAKALLLPYLNAEARGVPVAERPFVPRCLDVTWSCNNERRLTESIVSLDANIILGDMPAAHGQHGSLDRYST